MNKQESQNLMIGSWVLADGKPRQVHFLTTKKAGFKRGTNGRLDFFRFDQLRGIPLSEPLLKECVTVNPPKMLITEYMSVEFMLNMVVIKDSGETVDYFQFSNLHTMQSFFLSRYGCIVEFNVEKYISLMRPEMVVTKKGMNRFIKSMANLITKEIPNMVLEPSFIERLKEIGARPCASNPAVSGMPTLGEEKRGFKEGMLTFKE